MLGMLKKIAHHWQVKIFVQNTIGLLPNSIGFPLNEWLVHLFKGEIDLRINLIGRLQESINSLKSIKKETGFEFKNKTILELGTGWHGIDLIFFHLLGAKKIITIDHHRHLELQSLISKIPMFESQDIIANIEQNFPTGGEYEKRLKILKEASLSCSSLEEIFSLLNVEYAIATSCSPIGMNISPQSIDLLYSSSVLQRIPEKDLVRNMRFIGETLMSKNAVFYHLIDQRDVNSLNDEHLWWLDYLKHSDFLFNTFISGRFNSQNRLRESDFIEIINQSNMNVEFVKSYRRQSDVKRLRTFKLGKRFRLKAVEDLAIVHSQMIGRCCNSTGVSKPVVIKRVIKEDP